MGRAQSQQSSIEVTRQIVRKTEPRYPELARRLNIGGTVKLFVTVAPDGKVRAVEPAGGHPLLIEAARLAISEWRFTPGAESRELVEVRFDPHLK